MRRLEPHSSTVSLLYVDEPLPPPEHLNSLVLMDVVGIFVAGLTLHCDQLPKGPAAPRCLRTGPGMPPAGKRQLAT